MLTSSWSSQVSRTRSEMTFAAANESEARPRDTADAAAKHHDVLIGEFTPVRPERDEICFSKSLSHHKGMARVDHGYIRDHGISHENRGDGPGAWLLDHADRRRS